MLREARRQRGLPEGSVPAVCAHDADGDIVSTLRASGWSRRTAAWASYHAGMDVTEHNGLALGIVGLTVGPHSQCWWPNSCSCQAANC
jgi:hypothetical protein